MMGGLFSFSAALAPAMAAPVTFQFAGHLTAVDPTITTATGFTVGHAFAGTYTFESTTPDHPAYIMDFHRGYYDGAVINVHAKIDAQLVIAPQPIVTSNIAVADNVQSNLGSYLVDQYHMGALVNTTGTGWRVGVVGFDLYNGSSSTFDTDSLPTHPPSLASFATRQAFFLFFDGTTYKDAVGTLTSLTVVPIPTAALLFGTGFTALIGLGAQNWRRRQSHTVQAGATRQ
jgi:hypothetical protein